MTEKTASAVEWLYGLEDYFHYLDQPLSAEYIHDFVSTYYSQDPLSILKKLAVRAQSFDPQTFSKHINCYVRAVKHEYDLLEIASCVRDYSKERLVNSIHQFHRQGGDIAVLNDALSRSQIKSKIWLIDQLAQIQSNWDRVVVFAGWYGQLKLIYDRRLTYRQMRILELDRQACEFSDHVFNLGNLENYKVKAVNADINKLTLHRNGYEWSVENFREGTSYEEKFLPDLIINTSAEHMTEDWFFQLKHKDLESQPIVAIQSNNLFDIPEHVNCVHSQDHMLKKYPMSEVLYAGELQLKGYKRVMIIGRP
jgi:hypothetical protein